VDWYELALPVEGTRMSQVVYYFENGAEGLRIAMVDSTRMSMPELQPEFLALALAA